MKFWQLLAGVVVLGGIAVVIFNSGQYSKAITSGLEGVSHLVGNVQKAGGVVWLASFAGLWIVLAVLADVGAGELATALAGVIFVTVLASQLVNGQLQKNIQAFGVNA